MSPGRRAERSEQIGEWAYRHSRMAWPLLYPGAVKELEGTMHDEERRDEAVEAPGADRKTTRWGNSPYRLRVRGVAGRLRPYRDVRAAFEPWRRVALGAWAARDPSFTVH